MLLAAGTEALRIVELLVPHAYVLRWWLLAEALGLAMLPLLFRVCAALPGRGYAYARTASLALLTLALWLGGTIGVLPYGAGSALLVVLVLAGISIAIAAHDRAALWSWLREHRRYVLACELIFLVALLVITGFRAYAPEIANTEKPFEFAIYNAVDRARFFAPADPWFAGKPVAYYYLGYVTIDAVAKLTGTPPAYGFNIGLGLIGALTAVTAFGLAADCAALLGLGRKLRGWTIATGLLAVVLLLVIGNLEGVFELGAVHGWNPSWVYTHLDIQGLQPGSSPHWWPENFFASAWRATRLGSQWNFLEFPFFSFMLGDVHPHVLALPFKLLAAASALLLLVTPDLPEALWPPARWSAGAGALLSAAGALALLIGVHPWDFPPFLLLMAIVLAARPLLRHGEHWRTAVASGGAILACGLIVLAIYYLAGGRGSTTGIQPTEPYFTSLQGVVNAEGMYLPFQHLIIFWTPLMLPAALFAGLCLARRGWQPLARYGATALGLVTLLPLAWALTVAARHGFAGLRLELDVRGWGWLTVVTLAALLAFTLAALAGEAFDSAPTPAADGERRTRLFLLGAMVVAVLLVYGPELFMVRDSSGTRANSTFKLWYAAWTLLSVVAAAGIVEAVRIAPRPSFSAAVVRRAALGLCGVALAAALVYPAYVSFTRTNGFSGPTTLDGLAYLRQTDPQDYAAARWLNRNVAGAQTVLQADGNSYTLGGRFASWTGLPTLMGWLFHEEQQRGALPALMQRDADVRTIYTTTDVATALRLLADYHVQYVVVGPYEQQTYGSGSGLSKFADIGTLVYTTGNGTAIYRVGAAANQLVAAVRP